MMTTTNTRERRCQFAGAAWLAALTFVIAIAIPLVFTGSPAVRATGTPPVFGHLPLLFVPNRGQADDSVRFMTRTFGADVHFTTEGIVFNFSGAEVRLSFAGAVPYIEGIDLQPGRFNFMRGADPQEWISGVPTFGGIRYRRLYPGADVVYRGDEGRLKSEFHLSAGADPRRIVWRYDGVTGIRVDGSGELVIATRSGELRERRPEAYQMVDGRRVTVEAAYRLLGESSVGFEIDNYDRNLPLVIDPLLAYSTYLDGSGLDSAKAIAVDAAGNVYVTGQTDSLNFPGVGALQGQNAGGVDVFIAKLNAAGTSLVYCTYLGGSWDDRGFGIAVDGAGSAYIAGWTSSPNFPTTTGARQRVLGGGRDAFIAKLNAAGSAIVFSTYLGGAGHDGAYGIAVDGSGSVYVAGDTYSTNFPVISGFRTTNAGRQDAFVSKLRFDGAALLWSTYLGGSGDDAAKALSIDAAGGVYLTGGSDSPNFPVVSAPQGTSGGGQDAFVTKLSADGKSLVYSTYLGGSGGSVGANELGTGIRVDAAGSAYVAGVTSSTNFPTVNAFQPYFAGGTWDGFVAKLNPTGTAIQYSTFLGGVGIDYPTGLAVDPTGVTTVAGYTSSTDFPMVDALQSLPAGGYDAFVAKLNPQGNGLLESTYLGGGDNDAANGVFVDPAGAAYLAGQTLSSNFPVKNPLQSTPVGGTGAFLAKIGTVAPTAVYRAPSGATVVNVFGSTTRCSGGGVILSDPATAQNSSGDTYAAGRNNLNDVWMNIFQAATLTWKGWIKAGGPAAGNPALAVAEGGKAYVVVRDSSYNFRLNPYLTSGGFQGWVTLGGGFSSDPSAAVAPDGTVYIVGRTTGGGVQSGRYVSGAGFQGWISGGGTAAGKPAIAIGSDGAAYVSVKGTDNAIWIARLSGDLWGPWIKGGGTLGSDPDLAAAGGVVYAAVTGPTGLVYVQPFREGASGGWQGWISTNGTLNRVSIAAVGSRFFVAGRTTLNDFWWYQSGAGWSYYGNLGSPVSDLAAAPK
jgi:Beta-propeller repeat